VNTGNLAKSPAIKHDFRVFKYGGQQTRRNDDNCVWTALYKKIKLKKEMEIVVSSRWCCRFVHMLCQKKREVE